MYQLYNTNIHEKIAMGQLDAGTAAQPYEAGKVAEPYETGEEAEPTKIYEPKHRTPHEEREYSGIFATENIDAAPEKKDNQWMIYS